MDNNFFYNSSLKIRIIYAICLAGAGYNHAIINIQHGLLWNYGGAHFLTSTYWTSLTFFDPIAAIALFVKARFGVGLTTIIIVTDVLHNSWIILHYKIQPNWGYAVQILFLIFVLFTVKIAWQDISGSILNPQTKD